MRSSFNSILLAFLIVAACNNEGKTENKDADTTKTKITETTNTNPTDNTNTPSGDEQGCNKAMGQRYSKIQKGCVILIDLVTIQPQDPKLPGPAYLLFDSVRTEIYLPTQETSIIIRKTKSNPDEWENGPMKLRKTPTGYRLEDEGKVLYASGE